MTKFGFALLALVIATSSACSGSSNDKISIDPKPYNVAAARYGAVATSEADSENATNIIDEDEETFWTSTSGVYLEVELGDVEEIIDFSFSGDGLSHGSGAEGPDILVEFSENGDDFFPFSDFCKQTIRTNLFVTCSIDEEDPALVRYIRVTSQNGNSYDFSELVATAMKI